MYIYIKYIIYKYIYYWVLFAAALGLKCSLWDLNFPTRGQTYTPCTGSMES